MKNIMDLFSLKGKTALVTGGYRGIGKAVATALAQAGADVAIMARNCEAGNKAAEEITSLGVAGKFYHGDVTKKEDCAGVVSDIVNTFGKIDILVNNAATVRNTEAKDMTWEEWNDVINVNLNGIFLLSQIAGNEMIKNKSGSIINISSISSMIVNVPQPQCSYNVSKAGVNHLTRSLAYEWAKYNVRVNAIAPGYVETELLEFGLTTEMGKTWIDMTPMKRVGKPYEIGGLAIYLASDASSYMTGSVVVIDGAYTVI